MRALVVLAVLLLAGCAGASTGVSPGSPSASSTAPSSLPVSGSSSSTGTGPHKVVLADAWLNFTNVPGPPTKSATLATVTVVGGMTNLTAAFTRHRVAAEVTADNGVLRDPQKNVGDSEAFSDAQVSYQRDSTGTATAHIDTPAAGAWTAEYLYDNTDPTGTHSIHVVVTAWSSA